jgi:hypothetical protein
VSDIAISSFTVGTRHPALMAVDQGSSGKMIWPDLVLSDCITVNRRDSIGRLTLRFRHAMDGPSWGKESVTHTVELRESLQ